MTSDISSPLIGVPCFHDTGSGFSQKPTNAQYDAYLAALAQVGGVPFLIPLNLETPALRRLYDLADGILLTGGGDIDPKFYQQTPQAKLYKLQPDRDEVEICLSRWAMADTKPVLGICRGVQVMVVAAGGTLCQDVPTQMPQATLHNYVYQAEGTNAEDYLAHQVDLTPNSRLAQMLQTTSLWANSLHHQAVEQVSEPLQIVGYSSDGVVEAIEHPRHPFFCGVQWHPELILSKEPSASRVFESFITACANGVPPLGR